MDSLINVVCAVIKKDNKILVTQRSAKMSLPLKWEFPGGKIEDNESYTEALHREIMEELNICIRIKERIPIVIEPGEKFTINLIPYLAEYVSGDIVLEEHLQCRFISLSELTGLDWSDADIPVVRAITEGGYNIGRI